MDIDILCKVVDNYGDVGVAYRLARSLSELPDPPRLRLVVNDIASFAAVDPEIDATKRRPESPRLGAVSLDGEGTGEAASAFRARRPKIVIECFACGRPDWLEDILFDPTSEEGCLIVDVEHLTAEKYAEDFHRMPSLTRSPFVKKAMFLPGFADGTGGLLMDGSFARARSRASSESGRSAMRRELLARLGSLPSGRSSRPAPSRPCRGPLLDIRILLRTRLRSHRRRPRGIRRREADSRPRGRREESALPRLGLVGGRETLPLIPLPFLPQEGWDEILLTSDFSIVRGEDSWARAALSGRPFLWQAYPQEGRRQLVKVAAFLDRLRPYSAPESSAAFSALEEFYLSINDRDRDGPTETGRECSPPGPVALLRAPAPVRGLFGIARGHARPGFGPRDLLARNRVECPLGTAGMTGFGTRTQF